jgi:hypothetical protein
VPGQILNGRADEPARVQQFTAAAGNGSQELLRDALVGDLRRSGIVQGDGTLKPSAFADWQRRRAETINQFPGLSDQFRTAAAAQDALNEATASHQQALSDFQRSAAASFIRDDPTLAVKRAFGSRNPTETFTGLVSLVRGNADAEAGLKRAVVDYVLTKMSSGRAATETEDFLRADVFRKWVEASRKPLKVIFGGQGLQNLQAVAADLRRQSYSGVSASGSPTATYANAVRKLPGGHTGQGVGMSMLGVLGEQIGEHALGGHNLLGMVALPAAGMASRCGRRVFAQSTTWSGWRCCIRRWRVSCWRALALMGVLDRWCSVGSLRRWRLRWASVRWLIRGISGSRRQYSLAPVTPNLARQRLWMPEIPQPLVGGYNRFHIPPTLFLRGRGARQHHLQNMEKLIGDLVFALLAGVAEGDQDFV